MSTVSVPDFWQALYEQGQDGWELGAPYPSLVHFVETTPPPRGRVAVPGCGRGHDARFLASRGYEVVGFDFARAALAEAGRLARRDGVDVAFEQRDIFTLGRDYGRAFDGVWEYTCYCAIDPRRRAEYMGVVASIIKPGGWFLACFYPVRTWGAGPPYPVGKEETRRLLAPRFRIEREFLPPRPVVRRAGQEWMVYAVNTGGPA
ncbi:MAG TPA: methyltransferase domain-containing protein [Methylomirabilota bacterium]|nr:methyltransferase domain-containing protein [Methylomirabilota bacterium]